MTSIFKDIWHGLWTGFGVELSFMVLWLVWKLAHSKIAHKIHADHWFHKIGEYIDS